MVTGKSIVVSSGKGGVGKTNVAINLGIALAELGKKVAIIDGSLTTPDIALHLGIPLNIRGLSHLLKRGSRVNSASFEHKSGAVIIPGNVHVSVLKEFEGKKFSKLLTQMKKSYDFVFVDSAAGLGRESVSAIKSCDQMLVVANPEISSVVNASKAIQIAKDYKVKPIGVVINRTGRHKHELSHEEINPLVHRTPILGNIPEDVKVSIAVKNSEAIIEHYPHCRVSKEFRRIAFDLSGKRKKQQSFFRNMFSFFNIN